MEKRIHWIILLVTQIEKKKNTFNLESLFLDLFIMKCTLYFFFV